MNVALQKPWTVERCLEWDAGQELRYAFDGVRPVGMTGGTVAHDAIQVNLLCALGNRLEGKPCRVHGNSRKIRAMDSIRYPDARVSCPPLKRGAAVVHEPVVIFEILSDSTAHTDRMVKTREYAGTASVRRNVTLEQSSVGGMSFSRGASDRAWVGHILDADAVIAMPETGVELPIAELWGIGHIAIWAHGSTHFLPWHLLLDDETPLADSFIVTGSPSVTLLRPRPDPASRPRSGLFAFGRTFEDNNESGLPTLPSVSQELKSVGQVRGAKVYVNETATKAALAVAFREARWIHIATHGAQNPRAPSFHKILLSPGQDDDGALYA